MRLPVWNPEAFLAERWPCLERIRTTQVFGLPAHSSYPAKRCAGSDTRLHELLNHEAVAPQVGTSYIGSFSSYELRCHRFFPAGH